MTDTQAITSIINNDPIGLMIFIWLCAHGMHEDEETGEYIHTRTSQAYEYTMTQFRKELHKAGYDLDSEPTTVATFAELFARRSQRKGKQVTKTTINQRLACLSSFYQYAREKKYMQGENPIELATREQIQDYAHSYALDETAVQAALASIDQKTIRGARDYALLSVLFQTARRAQEVATLEWKHVHINNATGKATLTFEHVKGDEIMRDELPVSVTNALLRWVERYYGTLEQISQDTPLWVSLAHDKSYGQPLGYQSINALCKKHLHISRVHVTRHTSARAMEQVGLTVSEIQARLGHKSLATTGRYLASLRQAENRKGDELAARFGIE